MKRRAIFSILNFNGTDDTIECIKSLYKYEDARKYLVVIWDNASNDKEYQKLAIFVSSLDIYSQTLTESEYEKSNILDTTDIVLVKSTINYGFAIANNKVLLEFQDDFDYYIMLNNDTEFYDATTRTCLDFLDDNKSIGALTTTIFYYYDKSKVWNAGGKFVSGWRKYYTDDFVKKNLENGNTLVDVDYITGCYMILRKQTVKEHGLLSEKFFFGEEDYNYCLRMQRGDVRLCVRLDLGIWHKVGATASRDADVDKTIRLTFIHYLNRVVDMRDFYSRGHWIIWRTFSNAIFLRMALKLTGGDLKRSRNFIKQIYNNRMRDTVDKEFFQGVLKGNVDL